MLFAFTAKAQTFPVTISTQLTQPSPIYLNNYADASTINSPIKVQLILNDLTISNRQVRLKCYFQGNGISLVTNDFVVGARPLHLEGGFPLQLTNIDLAPYFQFQNIQGINPNQYAQALPEGIYTFSVEVYDFATGKKLSRKTSVTTIIFQNDPPFLNLPLNNASIMQQNIQNIIFSWTPRQINVSNVEYEFSLVEIWDKYTPVQNAFAYSPPLYTTTTRTTTLQYSLSEPQLIPGRRYAWRIKAKALANAEEVGVFKNNGYSEIYSFTYEVFCTAPLAIETASISQDQAKISWSGDIANYDYQVNYREKNASSEWYKLVTPREYATISNLKPNTTYEYTVGASCDLGKYTHSNIKEFTTMASDEIAFAGCGIKPDPNDLANKTPLPNLYPNDVVTAGDFPIVVLHATGSNGTFSGDGYVTLPFLEKFRKLIDAADALGGEKTNIGKFSRIRITFNNIGINTDFKLISGEIIASYDQTWNGISDLDPLINDVFGDIGNIVQQDVQFVIDKVVKNPDGTITVTGPNGVSFIEPKTANDIIFTDKDGKQYAVPPNAPPGDIAQTGQLAPGGIPTSKNTNGMASGGDVAQISSEDVTIIFSKGNGFYAFDLAPSTDNGNLNKTYETIPQKSGNPYKVNYKAISDSPNSTDSVTATATFKNGKTKDDIVFKTQTGTEIKSTWSGNTATIDLKRTLDFAKETIIATVKPTAAKDPKDPKTIAANYDIAGTMDIWHLSQKSINLKVISINNASITNVESELNAIYNKAGVKFNVATQNVNLPSNYYPKNTIECGDSGWLAQYTAEQQAIIAYVKTQITYEKDSYYVLVTNIPSSKGLAGFMPLKRQFGFIFSKATDKEEDKGSTVKTIAHELGHGIFGLQHPFTEYKTTTPTDLLMDYGTGTEFSHNDWQILHAPGLQLYLFQGDEAGELIEGTWYTSNWKPFKAKLEYIPVIEVSNTSRPEGTIRKIFIKNENAFYTYLPEKNDYFKDGDTNKPLQIKEIELSDSSTSPVFLYKYEGGCNKDSYYKTTHNMVVNNKKAINNLFTELKASGIFSCQQPTLENLKETGKEIYAYNKTRVAEKNLNILIQISSIGDIIGKDNYNSFVNKLRNDGNLFWANKNQQAPYTSENLNNTLESLKKFSDAIERIKTFDYKTIESLVKEVDDNFKITKGSNNIFVFPSDMRWTQLLTTPFANLSVERSKALIDLIEKATFKSNHVIGDPISAEQILDAILENYSKSTNINDKKLIIEHIRDKKYLYHFVNGISGVYYDSFINSIIIMTHQVYKVPEFKINPKKFLTFSSAYLQLNSETITNDSRVNLRVKQWIGDDKYDINTDPYEYVTVTFADDVDFGGDFKFKKNQRVQMSAICAYQLFHKDTRAAQWKSARIAGEVALTVVGVGEITAAIRLYRAGQTAYATYLGVKALGDVGFGLIDIYINNSDNSLTDAQKEKWNKFFMIYSIASISTTGIEVATKKVVSKLNKGGNSYSDFENAIEEANLDIDKLYKENIDNTATTSESLVNQLSKLADDINIPSNLREQFLADFANASEETTKALLKENSELLAGWKNFRKKYPNKQICNF
jgi:predicted Zn-dependent protease